MPIKTTVKLGDCISSLSKTNGFGDIASIWGDGANAALKGKRANANVLVVGDEITIPDKELKEIDKATGAAYKFTVKTLKTNLVVILQDETGAAISGKKYELVVDGDDKNKLTGSTPGDGKIEAKIEADAKLAELKLFLVEGAGIDGYLFKIDLGQLEHESTLRGVQARLLNLGFDCGSVTDTLDDKTKDAIKGYQVKMGTAPAAANGTINDALRNRLRTDHEGA